MSDGKILNSLRLMAWHRAKGELEAMLQTCYPKYGEGGKKIPGVYETITPIIDKFIKDMGDNL